MIIYKLLIVAFGILFYWYGEIYNKEFKYLMGVPIGIIGAFMLHSLIPLLCVLTYYIGNKFGYGDDNWLTKLLGKRGAITFCGFMGGLACLPIMPFLALWAALEGAVAFNIINRLDDKGYIKEPLVALLRGLALTIVYLT